MTDLDMRHKLNRAVAILDLLAEMFRCTDIDLSACQDGLSLAVEECQALISGVSKAIGETKL